MGPVNVLAAESSLWSMTIQEFAPMPKTANDCVVASWGSNWFFCDNSIFA
jgi:hypothetical protein